VGWSSYPRPLLLVLWERATQGRNHMRLLPISSGPVAIALLSSFHFSVAWAGPCGDYPNCSDGTICWNGQTCTCQKKNNSCGPWSCISGCRNEEMKTNSKAPADTSSAPAQSPAKMSSQPATVLAKTGQGEHVEVAALAQPACGSSCSIPAGICSGCAIGCPAGKASLCVPGEVWCAGSSCSCKRQPYCYCQ
jgi:hypothetical protein